MKYAVMSDVHANPDALMRVLDECTRLGVDQVVCAGDVVGYGPDPAATVRILRERGIPAVMGNHDAAVVAFHDDTGMIRSAQDGVARHRAELGVEDLAWLSSLPFVYEGGGFAVAHANFAHPDRMSYVYDRQDARASFTRRSERLLFVGHTHAEALFAFGIVSDPYFPDCGQVEPRDFRLVRDFQYLINVGSVGYPRVNPYSSFVSYDSDSGVVRFHHVDFDFRSYAESLRQKAIEVPAWMNDHG